MSVNISDILEIVKKQNRWRGMETLNMIASENTQSQAVRDVECSDFMGRYAEGHPNTPGSSRQTATVITLHSVKAVILISSKITMPTPRLTVTSPSMPWMVSVVGG